MWYNFYMKKILLPTLLIVCIIGVSVYFVVRNKDTDLLENNTIQKNEIDSSVSVSRISEPSNYTECVVGGGRDVTQNGTTTRTCILQNQVYQDVCVVDNKNFAITQYMQESVGSAVFKNVPYQSLAQSSALDVDRSIVFAKDVSNTVQLFQLALYSHNPKLIFETSKFILREDNSKPIQSFDVSNAGIVFYRISDRFVPSVFVLTKNNTLAPLGRLDYSASPDGKNIVVNITLDVDCKNRNVRTYHQKIYRISADNIYASPTVLFEDWYMDDGTDNTQYYSIAGWLKQSNDTVLLQKKYDSQLGATFNDVFTLDIYTTKIKQIFSIKDRQYKDIDQDTHNVIMATFDGACCGGLNYGNDQSFVYNLLKKTETKTFDEYATYNNEQKKWSEQHTAQKSIFSPKGNYIAHTIEHTYDTCERCGQIYNTPPTLLVTDVTGKEVYKENDAAVIGWIDADSILVKQKNNTELVSINMTTKEKTILLKDAFMDAWLVER